MKIQQVNNEKYLNNQPQFSGAEDAVLRYLATNQAVGANAVDLGFMVTPRTASDMVRRGPNAGLETFRREIMGTVNDSCLGLYGAAAGSLIALSMGIDKKYNNNVSGFKIKSNKILTDPMILDILAETKANQLKNKQEQVEYIKNIFRNVKAYNPSNAQADSKGYVKLSDELINKVASILNGSIDDKDISYSEWSKTKTANSRDVILNLLTEETGAQSQYILKSPDGVKECEADLKRLVGDIFVVSKSFNNENVKKEFEKQIAAGKTIAENEYIKSMSKFKRNKSYAGFVIASAIGLSVQPLNMYLTKLKTGSDGFVGVEGRSKDNSKGFLGIKIASAAAFFGVVLKTLNCKLKDIKTLPKDFMNKMAFKGLWPSISQLKGVYGITIISRILSARDKDELRESVTKDLLGYLSWLVLGGIVNKITANALEKENAPLINTTEQKEKGIWKNIKRAFHGELKTRDEVLIETLAQNGIKTTKEENGKIFAKTFKEMMKDLDKLTPEMKKIAKSRLRALNWAQYSGYLFSGLVLGLGIPNLNIYITNTLDKKRKAKQAQKIAQQ